MWPDPKETADLVTFIEETFNGKLDFLCGDIYRKTRYYIKKNQYQDLLLRMEVNWEVIKDSIKCLKFRVFTAQK